MKTVSLFELATFEAETRDINVIVETPAGSRNKYKYDPQKGLFKLDKVLPAGSCFPYDFGFIPSTLGQDGDPLDVLILMEEPGLQGNLVTARLIGAIEADQTEDRKTIRNDRLIAIAGESLDYRSVKELEDLDQNLLFQIEHFFISYNEFEGRQFKPIGRPGAQQAKKLLEAGRKLFMQRHQK